MVHSYPHNDSSIVLSFLGTFKGDMGGPGTVFFEERLSGTEWQSRLYIDGRGLQIPKPVVLSQINPRLARENLTIFDSNKAAVHFDHLLLQNRVSYQFQGKS